jgi:hypothetical protein
MSQALPPYQGVGMPYLRDLPDAMETLISEVNFLELTPEALCHERSGGAGPEMVLRDPLFDEFLSRSRGKPIVVHGVELSIASASGWNSGYLDLLRQVAARCPFSWHSEHLSFLRVAGGGSGYTGVPLPPPCTKEAMDLIAGRARLMQDLSGRPFLLENGVHFLPDLSLDGELDEIDLLNGVTEVSGCWLLLDLFNLYCNSLNHHFDPLSALRRLRLDRVMEIHLAGGANHDGYLMDSHSAVVPEPVWDLLAYVIPRTPNLRGVVYEILDVAFPLVGIDGTRRPPPRSRAVGAGAHLAGADPLLTRAGADPRVPARLAANAAANDPPPAAPNARRGSPERTYRALPQ